jgi:hypothetical protein
MVAAFLKGERMNTRSWRPIAMLSRRLAAPVAVLALAVGASVAAPAAYAGLTPGCSWHSLITINGWGSAGSVFGTGDPAYCIDNGFVYLSGSISDSSPNYTWFAVLPQEGRPANDRYFPAYTFAGTTGSVAVWANGDMLAYGGSADQFTSLAGISFPVAGTALQSLPIDPPWQSAASQYRTGGPSYVISNGIIHLSGGMVSTSLTANLIDWVPPASILSDRCIEANVYTYNGQNATLLVNPEYHVNVIDNGPPGYAVYLTVLDGVSYPVAGTPWQPLNLQNGWTASAENNCPTGAPASYISQGIVYLTGALAQTQPGTGPVAVLPAQAWPAHDLWLSVNAGYGAPATLHITTTGQMFLSGGAWQPNQISLTGLAYPASS